MLNQQTASSMALDDILIEGLRPGVMERLDLGYDESRIGTLRDAGAI